MAIATDRLAPPAWESTRREPALEETLPTLYHGANLYRRGLELDRERALDQLAELECAATLDRYDAEAAEDFARYEPRDWWLLGGTLFVAVFWLGVYVGGS